MELARNLKIESVCRLRPTPPRRLAPEQTVADAVALKRQFRIGCVLICRGEMLVGIFTERDLMRRVLADGKPCSTRLDEVMTPHPAFVRPKEPIGAAVRLMERGGYRHLPVVDDLGRPLGVLSVKRIVHYLAEHYPATVCNQPPDPAAFPRRAEGA